MSAHELDKETYRSIIETYFRSFGTRDFSQVQFSSQVQFLSPLSDIPLKGREAIENLVSGVVTRVSSVDIISIAVDFPTASGVWQMTTTKGVKYTLHNFFRLDGEGLAFIWPMFDPKAILADPPGLHQWLTGDGYYSIAAPRRSNSQASRYQRPAASSSTSPGGSMIPRRRSRRSPWTARSWLIRTRPSTHGTKHRENRPETISCVCKASALIRRMASALIRRKPSGSWIRHLLTFRGSSRTARSCSK